MGLERKREELNILMLLLLYNILPFCLARGQEA